MFLSLSATGYFLLGDCMEYNMLDSISDGPMRMAAQILMLIHLVVAFPIGINVPNQYIENLLDIPKERNWRRVAFRMGVLTLLLFCAESVPSFGNIMDFVGASSITILTFILPPLMYMLAVKGTKDR